MLADNACCVMLDNAYSSRYARQQRYVIPPPVAYLDTCYAIPHCDDLFVYYRAASRANGAYGACLWPPRRRSAL